MLVYFEGIDGVGKSTQISLFNDLECVKTCEPGGTKLGKSLRELIFNAHPSSRAEIFLFLADRAEHYEKIIKINKYKLILSDRSFVSGLAYAMASHENYDISELIAFNNFALQGDFDAKFVLLLADETLLKTRLKKRGTSDNIEARGINYLLSVQNHMQTILQNLKLPHIALNANSDKNALHKEIKKFIGI